MLTRQRIQAAGLRAGLGDEQLTRDRCTARQVSGQVVLEAVADHQPSLRAGLALVDDAVAGPRLARDNLCRLHVALVGAAATEVE